MADIHELPQEPLERLALQIKRDLFNCEQGILKSEEGAKLWKEAAFSLCIHLYEAKKYYPVTADFGNWRKSVGLGEETISYHKVAAAVSMGEEPEKLRECLEKTDRRSLETIYYNDFPRLAKLRKLPKSGRRGRPFGGPRTDVARDAVRPLVEAGLAVDRAGLAKRLGVSPATIERAHLSELGRLKGIEEAKAAPPIEPDQMPRAMRARFDAALRKAKKELREELTAEISKEMQWYMDQFADRIKRADKINDNFNGIMTEEQYQNIWYGLHPNYNTTKWANESFGFWTTIKDQIVKPAPKEGTAPAFPRTVEEMLARKRQLDLERRARRDK